MGGVQAAVLRRWQASAFSPVLASPVLRRLLPALAVSAVGDGMSAVGVAWLAIRIASPADRGLVVGVAVAAYSLPGAAGAVLLAKPLRKLAGRRLVAADATLRASALAMIPLLYAFGALAPGLYVALLAASSLLHAWGISGQYTLVAEHLPLEARTAGTRCFPLSARSRTSSARCWRAGWWRQPGLRCRSRLTPRPSPSSPGRPPRLAGTRG